MLVRSTPWAPRSIEELDSRHKRAFIKLRLVLKLWVGRVHRAWLHINQLPNVTIQILEPVSIHKTMVLRLIVSGATGGDSFANHLIDICPALERQADKHFGIFFCVANLF